MKKVKETLVQPFTALNEQIISDYFELYDGMGEIEELFWWMLYYSQSNENNSFIRSHDGQTLDFYRQTILLLREVLRYSKSVGIIHSSFADYPVVSSNPSSQL